MTDPHALPGPAGSLPAPGQHVDPGRPTLTGTGPNVPARPTVGPETDAAARRCEGRRVSSPGRGQGDPVGQVAGIRVAAKVRLPFERPHPVGGSRGVEVAASSTAWG